jgi:TldD protein
MLGDETMLEEWEIGKRVGRRILSIVDDGRLRGTGYSPIDDDGQEARKTYLIKRGVLTGRLHSAETAAEFNEESTGNARAVSFEYEPIVRMTSTYIEPGELSREELFGGVKEGYFIKTFTHGSGMSTFTIAPSLAYRIENGKISSPVKIAVVTGNVFQTLGEIDGVSDELELISSVGGGCGKMEQFPLPVAVGGPYVRVRKMQVA